MTDDLTMNDVWEPKAPLDYNDIEFNLENAVDLDFDFPQVKESVHIRISGFVNPLACLAALKRAGDAETLTALGNQLGEQFKAAGNE